MPAGIPVCKARPTVSAYADASSPDMLTCCLIRVRPSTSSNVKTNLATAPGAGNSRTALPGCNSATRHSIRPELLVCVTPLTPTANGPSSCTEMMSASSVQLLTFVQKFHANSFETEHSTVCSNVHSWSISITYPLCGEDSTSRLVAESSTQSGNYGLRSSKRANRDSWHPHTSATHSDRAATTRVPLYSPSCLSFCSALARISLRRASGSAVSVASSSSAFFAFWRAKSFCPSAR